MLAVLGISSITLGVLLTLAGRRSGAGGTSSRSWFFVQMLAVPITALIGGGIVMMLVFGFEGRWRDISMIEALLAAAAAVAGGLSIRLARQVCPKPTAKDPGAPVSASEHEKRRRAA